MVKKKAGSRHTHIHSQTSSNLVITTCTGRQNFFLTPFHSTHVSSYHVHTKVVFDCQSLHTVPHPRQDASHPTRSLVLSDIVHFLASQPASHLATRHTIDLRVRKKS